MAFYIPITVIQYWIFIPVFLFTPTVNFAVPIPISGHSINTTRNVTIQLFRYIQKESGVSSCCEFVALGPEKPTE